jgi:hypothetical protein
VRRNPEHVRAKAEQSQNPQKQNEYHYDVDDHPDRRVKRKVMVAEVKYHPDDNQNDQ